MQFLTGLIVVLWLIAILLIIRSIVSVPTGSAYVVKRLGRVHRVLDPGLHFVVPIVSTVSAKISTLEQVIEVPAFVATTADGDPARVRGTLRFQVNDPARATSEVADFRKAITDLATSRWTAAITGSATVDALNAIQASESTIKDAAAVWGIEVQAATPLLMIEEEPSASEPDSGT